MPIANKYEGSENYQWRLDTEELLREHELFNQKEILLDYIFRAWEIVWDTKIGNAEINIPLIQTEPRAQIIGEFFETIFAILLAETGQWQRGSQKEKDILSTDRSKPNFDFEIKTSGQSGGKIFGNRSYAQPDQLGEMDSTSRKGKNGFYLCINFFQNSIYKIRIGWIDSKDWEPQKSPTGQMAGLKSYVYNYKLIELHHPLMLKASPRVLPGVGDKSPVLEFDSIEALCSDVRSKNITTKEITDFISTNNPSSNIKTLKSCKSAIRSQEFLTLYTMYLEQSVV